MDRQAELADIIEAGDRKERAGIWDPEHAEFCYIRKCHFSPVTQSQFQTGARSEKNLPYISINLSDADISDRQILEWSIARVTENWVTCMYLTAESAVVFGH